MNTQKENRPGQGAVTQSQDHYAQMKPQEQVKAAPAVAQETEVICMEDIEMKPISWLWPDRIACGKLTVIAGNPGLGKSQITAALAAAVSAGKHWPEGQDPASSGSVIILSAEDDPADTIKPRLLAAGADLQNCHVLTAIRTPDHEGGRPGIRTFDLTKDVERLGAVMESMGNVRLVVIDPISAYLGKTDSHNNADMRGALAPLAEMAMRHEVAVLLVTHLNKSKEQEMIGRVIGSIGLIAAARAGYAVVKDEQDPDKRYFLPIKNNIGNDRDGFAFRIGESWVGQGIKTSRVCWQPGLVEAHPILYPEKKTQLNGAGEFLEELLSAGPKMAGEVFEAAESMGYNKAAIQRAKRRLGIKHRKLGLAGGFEWSLPLADGGDPEDGNT